MVLAIGCLMLAGRTAEGIREKIQMPVEVTMLNRYDSDISSTTTMKENRKVFVFEEGT